MKLYRVGAIIIRYQYLYRHNIARIFDVVFWPLIDLMMWGFISLYLLQSQPDLPAFVGYLLGAVILWDVMLRSNLGVSVGFLEDVWSRNLLNYFASPLTVGEYILGLVASSVLRILISGTVLVVAAFVFYHFSIFTLGLSLIPLFLNLILFGTSIGIVTSAIILRFGQSVEVLAWAFAVFFMPFSAVYYPVAVLPGWMRAIAAALPSSHIFEGMRAVIATGSLPRSELVWAIVLNVLYAVAAVLIFFTVFHRARKNGRIARQWE